MDRVKFTKIMMLTTSDADGEALAAIRKANAMLKADKINWEEFLTPSAAKLSRTQDEPWVTPTKRWRRTANGNTSRLREDGVRVTVFFDERRDCWKWVCEGRFSQGYPTEADAKRAVDTELSGQPY